MQDAKAKLRLISDGQALGVERKAWEGALQTAQADPVVGIRHAAISGNATYRLHVAAIPDRVGCHFHAHGDEDYAVVSGSGTLRWGKAEKTPNGYDIAWETSVDVESGDRFVIPEGYAHQLIKRGETDLVILFGCPDSHLDDAADRTVIAPISFCA